MLTRWNECLVTPQWAKPPRWLHGDLHPANLLVHGGRIAAVVDFGDISGGDPANDLSVAWMMLPANVRSVFRAAVGAVDDDTWERARGWALFLAVTFVASSGRQHHDGAHRSRNTRGRVVGQLALHEVSVSTTCAPRRGRG